MPLSNFLKKKKKNEENFSDSKSSPSRQFRLVDGFEWIDVEAMYSPLKNPLSNNLKELMCCSESVPYLLTFLESRKSSNLLLFLLDVKNFESEAPSGEKAVQLYQKFLAPDSLKPLPELPVSIKHDIVQRICSESGVVEKNAFDVGKDFIYSELKYKHFEDFLRSEYYIQLQVDLLENPSTVSLVPLLTLDTLLFSFMEFIECLDGKRLLNFWISVVNLKNQNEMCSSDVWSLFDRFISQDGSDSLGFSSSIRTQIQKKIKENSSDPNIFDEIANLVIHVLEIKYLDSFLHSNFFLQFFSDIKSTMDFCKTKVRRSDSHSSLSSTYSLNTKSKSLRCSSEDHNSSNNNIEFDPNNIWKHRMMSGVNNIGSVDHLGRYISSIESPPPHSELIGRESKLNKVMSLLGVTSSISKVQEEMAWHVAEVIVEEITTTSYSKIETL